MAIRLNELAGVLELERCPFLRAALAGGAAERGTAVPGCWATGEPLPVPASTHAARCTTTAHAACPTLLDRLDRADVASWLAVADAARVVVESCRLAQAHLEVRAEQLGTALDHLFGDEP